MRTKTRTVTQLPAMVAGLRLALTIGAAREVATPDQTERINAEVLSAMCAPTWLLEANPAGVWAQQLAVLS